MQRPALSRGEVLGLRAKQKPQQKKQKASPKNDYLEAYPFTVAALSRGEVLGKSNAGAPSYLKNQMRHVLIFDTCRNMCREHLDDQVPSNPTDVFDFALAKKQPKSGSLQSTSSL